MGLTYVVYIITPPFGHPLEAAPPSPPRSEKPKHAWLSIHSFVESKKGVFSVFSFQFFPLLCHQLIVFQLIDCTITPLS